MVQLIGAGAFGAIVGWYVYYINRYRTGGVQFTDLVTLIGVLGGATVLALFPGQSDLFGAYGIGLAIGFFGYFLILFGMVTNSANFDIDWFLDGRRKKVQDGYVIPSEIATTVRPMEAPPSGSSRGR